MRLWCGDENGVHGWGRKKTQILFSIGVLCCVHGRSHKLVLRPLTETMHGTEKEEVTPVDSLYLEDSERASEIADPGKSRGGGARVDADAAGRR